MRSRALLAVAALLVVWSAAFLVWLRWLPAVDPASLETEAAAPEPASPHPADDGTLAANADPAGIAIHAATGRIYWSEYGSGRIRAANPDGRGVETIVEGLDGPVGVAVSDREGILFWTTDGTYPRKVERADLDGAEARELIGGAEVNRPGAIAVDDSARDIYWSESVAGRIRRLGTREVVDVVDSGVSSSGDRAGAEVTWVLGIAVDADARKLYWTELTSGTIHRANLDGTEDRVLVGADGSCDSPAGIVLDHDGGTMYWADVGCGAIFKADLDGAGRVAIVTAEDGLVGPRALAIDRERRKLYWTDAVTEKIQRADLDGSQVEDVVLTAATEPPFRPGDCAEAVRVEGRAYAERKAHAMSVCLDKVGAVKAVKRGEADAAKVAPSCVVHLRRYEPETGPVDAALGAAVEAACPRRTEAGVAVADCPQAEAMSDCVRSKYTALAWRTVAARFPRALEWVEEVRPFVNALDASGGGAGSVKATLAVLDDLANAARGQPPPEAAAGPLPASGLVTSYAALGRAVPDDGALRAGAPMRFRDNGDGTITDLVTRLTWEKKCDCPDSLHDYRTRLPWSGNGQEDTVWDWLTRINSEGGTGFAGHSDWRVPNAKELISIIDYERFNPAVTAAFDGALCGLGCGDLLDPDCSCTTMKAHWSSTSFADNPANALAVGFHLGLLGDVAKTEDNAVRAVRGGTVGSSAAD